MLTNTTNDAHKHNIPYGDEQSITWAMSSNTGKHTADATVRKMLQKEKRVCQNVHILFFMHKAPTFSSQGFAIS